jgi:putative DNA-invertase from lambdoid prophage Rac
VLVWWLDRWGRSVADLLATLQEPEHRGIGFVSLTEALDLTTLRDEPWPAYWQYSPTLSREILRERVRAGLAHDWQNGKKFGRPITAESTPTKCGRLHRVGVSKAEIARRLQIDRTSGHPAFPG